MREALLDVSSTSLGALVVVLATLLLFAGGVALIAWLMHRHPGVDDWEPWA